VTGTFQCRTQVFGLVTLVEGRDDSLALGNFLQTFSPVRVATVHDEDGDAWASAAGNTVPPLPSAAEMAQHPGYLWAADPFGAVLAAATQYRKVAGCFGLVQDFEASGERGSSSTSSSNTGGGGTGAGARRPYAWVVRARFDAGWFRPVPPAACFPHDRVWVKNNMRNGVHDQFALVPRHLASAFFGASDALFGGGDILGRNDDGTAVRYGVSGEINTVEPNRADDGGAAGNEVEGGGGGERRGVDPSPHPRWWAPGLIWQPEAFLWLHLRDHAVPFGRFSAPMVLVREAAAGGGAGAALEAGGGSRGGRINPEVPAAAAAAGGASAAAAAATAAIAAAATATAGGSADNGGDGGGGGGGGGGGDGGAAAEEEMPSHNSQCDSNTPWEQAAVLLDLLPARAHALRGPGGSGIREALRRVNSAQCLERLGGTLQGRGKAMSFRVAHGSTARKIAVHADRGANAASIAAFCGAIVAESGARPAAVAVDVAMDSDAGAAPTAKNDDGGRSEEAAAALCIAQVSESAWRAGFPVWPGAHGVSFEAERNWAVSRLFDLFHAFDDEEESDAGNNGGGRQGQLQHVFEVAIRDPASAGRRTRDATDATDAADADAGAAESAWRALQGPTAQRLTLSPALGAALARAACCAVLHAWGLQLRLPRAEVAGLDASPWEAPVRGEVPPPEDSDGRAPPLGMLNKGGFTSSLEVAASAAFGAHKSGGGRETRAGVFGREAVEASGGGGDGSDDSDDSDDSGMVWWPAPASASGGGGAARCFEWLDAVEMAVEAQLSASAFVNPTWGGMSADLATTAYKGRYRS